MPFDRTAVAPFDRRIAQKFEVCNLQQDARGEACIIFIKGGLETKTARFTVEIDQHGEWLAIEPQVQSLKLARRCGSRQCGFESKHVSCAQASADPLRPFQPRFSKTRNSSVHSARPFAVAVA